MASIQRSQEWQFDGALGCDGAFGPDVDIAHAGRRWCCEAGSCRGQGRSRSLLSAHQSLQCDGAKSAIEMPAKRWLAVFLRNDVRLAKRRARKELGESCSGRDGGERPAYDAGEQIRPASSCCFGAAEEFCHVALAAGPSRRDGRRGRSSAGRTLGEDSQNAAVANHRAGVVLVAVVDPRWRSRGSGVYLNAVGPGQWGGGLGDPGGSTSSSSSSSRP